MNTLTKDGNEEWTCRKCKGLNVWFSTKLGKRVCADCSSQLFKRLLYE